jgi:hypothetical protein
MRTAQSPKRTPMEFLQTAYDAATDPRPMGSFRAGIDRPRGGGGCGPAKAMSFLQIPARKSSLTASAWSGRRCTRSGALLDSLGTASASICQNLSMCSRTPADRSPALLEWTGMACPRKNRTRSNRPPSASTGFCIQYIRRNIGMSPWASFRMLDARRQDR